MTRQILRLAVLAGVTTLSACGGGGGGDSDGGNPVVPAAAAITAANYQGVAQQTLSTAMYLGDTTALVSGAQVAPGGQALFAFSQAQMRRLPGLLGRATRVVTGVTSTERIDCSGGGTVTATLTDVNGNGQADVGDSGTLVASNCGESGASINGSITLSFTAISGDFNSDSYAATVSMTLSDLRATSDAGGVTGNGQFRLSLTSTDANTGTVEINVASLTMSGVFAGTNDTVTLQDWRLTGSTALVAGRVRSSTSISGGVASASLASGLLTVATAQPLLQYADEAYPYSGQLTTTGANSSRVRLTVQSTSTVLLELDADGNGSFETSVNKAWSSLV